MMRGDLWDAYGEQSKRLKARDKVIAEVDVWTSSMKRNEVIDRCVANDVPAGAINSVADIFTDTLFEAREDLVSLDVPGIGEVVVPSVYPRLSESPGTINFLGPELGDANDEVYGGWLGLSNDDRNSLAEKGVI